MEKLYIVNPPETKNLKEFIEYFFQKPSIINKNKCITAVSTFLDEKCENLQTNRGKRRSFGDVIDVVQTYLPFTSKEIIKEIFDSIIIPGHAKMLMCDTVNKVVIYDMPVYQKCDSIYKYVFNYRDTDLCYNKQKLGRYTIKQLLDIGISGSHITPLGIHNLKMYKKLCNNFENTNS